MPVVDLVVGAVIAAAAVWGLTRGLSSLALAGFVVGAVLGTRAPVVLGGQLRSSSALFVALPAALILGGLLALLAEQFGPDFRRRRSGHGPINRAGGALLTGCLAVVGVWIAGPVVERVGAAGATVERSAILARLNSLMAPVGSPVDERPAAGDDVATISGGRAGAAPVRAERDPDVLGAQRSIVKILASGCGSGRQGSGWLVADGIVVTNAHVVVKADRITTSARGTGPAVRGTAIWFDPVNDLALVRAPGLRGLPALEMVRHPLTAGHPRRHAGLPEGKADRPGGPSRLRQSRPASAAGRGSAGRVSPRQRREARDGLPRPRATRQLGRPAGQHGREGPHHRLRFHGLHHERVRGAQRLRARGPAQSRPGGRHRGLLGRPEGANRPSHGLGCTTPWPRAPPPTSARTAGRQSPGGWVSAPGARPGARSSKGG